MIIVKLKGGLGNQMFQYAAGRQLSIIHKSPLKLDLSFLQGEATDYTKREYELDKFNITAEIATPEEVEQLKKKSWKKLFRKTKIRERIFGVFKTKLRGSKNCYLNGYWQSEDYFDKIPNIIRDDFTFIEPLTDNYFLELQEQITKSNSVSIHFRRGDYVTDLKTNKTFGVCSIDYYQKAVEFLSKRVSNLRIFAFSEDIEWVKSNFNTHHPIVFVEKSDENLHSDFRLMSMCKHNIIANSSYSWWAAWLNSNEEKIVVAPQKWYENKRKQYQSADRVPESWVKL